MQIITQSEPSVLVLQVENPSCLWGRVSRDAEMILHYNSLFSQMNVFYNNPAQDRNKLKPPSLQEGQVCVVYSVALKLWCRAVVESVSLYAHCLLVDHGEKLAVPTDQIRVAVPNFLRLPFWVRRFHLARIKPMTLRVSVLEEKAQLVPSCRWDCSATLYLHNLLKGSTQAEAVLLESESSLSSSSSIELYLTVNGIKIQVNDDLVMKKFAYYSSDSADGNGCGLGEEQRVPLMLPTTILMAQNHRPAVSPSVMSKTRAAGAAGDCLAAPHPPPTTPPQSPEHEPSTSTKDVTEVVPFGRSQSRSCEAAAMKSDSSEDEDSSLAAALIKKLNLFRFLNPNINPQQATSSRVSEDEDLKESEPKETTPASAASAEQNLSTSQSEESEPVEQTRMYEADWICARFLQWLNPRPLNPNSDNEANIVVPHNDARSSGILVHFACPMEPCSSLDRAPITDGLRRVLQQKQYSLSPADRYSWPAVARGSHTMIISNSGNEPLAYLPPLLTHILLNTMFVSLTSSSGPVAVVLCPGWEKVQVVFDLLEDCKVTRILHSVSLLLGIGKDEAQNVKISKDCRLLVTTPFTMVRLLSHHCFMFLRLHHLVLDEADQLFTLAADQMATILEHFRNVTSSEANASCPQQLVAIAKKWSSHMEDLLASYMPYPSIVITVPEEAALYGNIQQIILMTLESNKISVLLRALEFRPGVGQKTLIITDSAQEVEEVFETVNRKSAFCMKIHEGLMEQFDFVTMQWRKDIGAGTHVILVTTDECLKGLDVRGATCVVHFSFPSSPRLFGTRLLCMCENFRNLSERDQTKTCRHGTKSVLLISERNTHHMVGVLRYLSRTNALLPSELLSFTQGMQVARECQKMERPLCSHLKSFGVCRDNSTCPDRHHFIPQLDQSDLPASGVIEVIPLHIKTASVFCGRIVKDNGGFAALASEMASYYTEKKTGARELQEGGLYAVEQDNFFHRVKILSVPDKGGRLFFWVSVRFIDVGKEEVVKSYQILQLPEPFHALPPQAIEIIVCKVKPADAETNWHPKVTRAINQKIRGLQHRARVVLSLGKTIFVDPMVRITQIPGMKMTINEHSIQMEILNSGMGVTNPEHVDLLQAFCQEGQDGSRDPDHMSRTADDLQFLETRIDPVDDLSKTVAASDGPPSTHESLFSEPLEVHPAPACDQTVHTNSADMKSPGQVEQSFHPQIRWRQRSDVVILTVKLMNPENQCCRFYADQVVYRSVRPRPNPVTAIIQWSFSRRALGTANGRFYKADLELHQSVIAEQCCWEMKSYEPVIKLVKQEPGTWERLLKNKNIFVNYDMDHFDEDEDCKPNGRTEEEILNSPLPLEEGGELGTQGVCDTTSGARPHALC
ncbi:putative ATP-dependent RNA helicase TDRD12 [Pholidichthys leucotaenia]